MRLSTAIKLVNVLIVLALVSAFAVSFLVAINSFGVVSSIRVGEPSATPSESSVEISLPINLSNPGPFAVSGVRIYGELRGVGGDLIASASSTPFSVAAGEIGAQRRLAVRINFSQIPHESLRAIFSQAGNLTLLARAEAVLDPFIHMSAEASGKMPWEPPVRGFQLGDPDLLSHNSTHIFASIPVRFENPSIISVEGSVGVLFVDADSGNEIGSGYMGVSAPPRSVFEGAMQSYFRLPENMTEMLVESRAYRCNATLHFSVFGVDVHSVSIPFELHWDPPVGSPYLGSPSVTPYNSTHSLFSLPFGFTNENGIITLEGSVRMDLAIGGAVVSESDPVLMIVPPGQPFSSSLTMIVPNSALSQPGTIVMSMDTQFGSASLEVPFNG